MMFSFPTSLVYFRNAVTKANIHSLYICIVGRTNSNYQNQDNTKKMVDPKRVLSYEDMLEVIHEPKKVIIDVRNPEEVASTGKIPSSINIPLPSIRETLGCMSDEDFRRKFKREKPTRNDDLIFYCRSGNRSTQALDEALQLGYKKFKKLFGKLVRVVKQAQMKSPIVILILRL